MVQHVTVKGPLFDGSMVRAIESYQKAATEAIAQDGVNLVRQRLGEVLRHPSGRYQGSVQTSRVREDLTVTDGGVIYGPWLEGTSSRNESTRFKGYSTFRRVTQELDKQATAIATRELERFRGKFS
jgi:hypothetical protein